jgi:hypothetical protein
VSLQKLQHIPLKSAYLCQDCNAIGNSSRRCPACASEVLLSLAGVLNREETKATPKSPYVIRRPLLAAWLRCINTACVSGHHSSRLLTSQRAQWIGAPVLHRRQAGLRRSRIASPGGVSAAFRTVRRVPVVLPPSGKLLKLRSCFALGRVSEGTGFGTAGSMRSGH